MPVDEGCGAGTGQSPGPGCCCTGRVILPKETGGQRGPGGAATVETAITAPTLSSPRGAGGGPAAPVWPGQRGDTAAHPGAGMQGSGGGKKNS